MFNEYLFNLQSPLSKRLRSHTLWRLHFVLHQCSRSRGWTFQSWRPQIPWWKWPWTWRYLSQFSPERSAGVQSSHWLAGCMQFEKSSAQLLLHRVLPIWSEGLKATTCPWLIENNLGYSQGRGWDLLWKRYQLGIFCGLQQHMTCHFCLTRRLTPTHRNYCPLWMCYSTCLELPSSLRF